MNKLERKEAVIKTARRLLDVAVDDIVSIAQLSEAAEQDLLGERWIISAALRAINAEYGAVFATVRKEGYRRLANSDGALFAGNRGLYRIRRAGRTAMRYATNAARHANDMSGEQRKLHHQQLATLGIIAHLTRDRSVATMPDDAPAKDDPLAGLKQALGL